MGFLGDDFSVLSIIWLTIIFIFMFIFRKKIFAFYYKDGELNNFVKKLKAYLEDTYPNINFKYDFLDTLIKNEPNPDAVKYALIDNIINQYTTIELDLSIPKKVPTDKLWGTYTFNSKPNKTKLPEDWLQRKAVLFERDKKTCQRCSKKVKITESDIFMLNPLSNGGQYYFENLLLLCIDCHKIENSKRDNSINIKYLDIKDNLYELVK
jgi:hypothetical protein